MTSKPTIPLKSLRFLVTNLWLCTIAEAAIKASIGGTFKIAAIYPHLLIVLH